MNNRSRLFTFTLRSWKQIATTPARYQSPKYFVINFLQWNDAHRQYASKSGGRAAVKLMGLGNAVTRKDKNYQARKPRSKLKPLSRADMIDPDVSDWSSIFEAAQSYNQSVIPIPIRMGRPRHNRVGDVPPNDRGNIELLKIPNFFHLTPPAIKKHCEVLKEYCTPWPKDIGSRPLRITAINYVYAGPSIRHPRSRRVKLQMYLKDLDLDAHARKKLILLVGDRYNPGNDELTLITDSCPTRKQNKEYAYYLLTALYYESWKTEPWEEEANGKTDEEIAPEIEQVNVELNPKQHEEKRNNRRHYRIINGKLIRYNNVGHPFIYELKKYGITGGLKEHEIKLAKEEWTGVQKDLPDTSTFDPVFQRSSESEFKQN